MSCTCVTSTDGEGVSMALTQYGDHHAGLQHLHGPVAHKVYVGEGVARVHQVLARRAEVAPHVPRQQLEAPLGGLLEDRQRQDFLVQVHGRVPAQLVGEFPQDLRKRNPFSIRSHIITIYRASGTYCNTLCAIPQRFITYEDHLVETRTYYRDRTRETARTRYRNVFSLFAVKEGDQ